MRKGMNDDTERLKYSKSFEESSDNRDTYDEAGDVLRRSIARLERIQIVVFEGVEAGVVSPLCLRELAGVARSVTSTAAEVRNREKHARIRLDKMTDSQKDDAIRSYISELSRDRREAIKKFIVETEERENLLG